MDKIYSTLDAILDFILLPFEFFFALLELAFDLAGIYIIILMVLFLLKGPYYIIRDLIKWFRSRKNK